jgi:NADH-quinone oxidoreductase subunit N
MTLIQTFLVCSGIVTILVGSFLAIQQKRFKRLVIYSSIAQGGFLIAGTSVNSSESTLALLFFIVIYIITSTLIWFQFAFFYASSTKINVFLNKSNPPIFLSTLSNFFQTNKIWALSFIFIFFSLAGLPPLSGFFSKILVLLSILKTQIFSLNVLLLLISAVSVFYYLKVIKTVFFELKSSQLKHLSFQVGIGTLFFDFDCLIIAFFLSLLFFLFLNPNLLLLLLEVPALSISFF